MRSAIQFTTVLLLLVQGLAGVTTARSESVRAVLTVLDQQQRPVQCRVCIRDADGKAIQPKGLPFWRGHFCCRGRVELDLPAGTYQCEVERGPENVRKKVEWEVAAGDAAKLTVHTQRIEKLSEKGWYAGDLHIHRPVKDVPLLIQANDLHIAPVITWWNARNPWEEGVPDGDLLRQTDDGRYYHIMAGEDERGGGALLYFGLKRPLAIARAQREHPSSLKYLNAATQHEDVWVDIEKPFWLDVPLWLASGKTHSMGIAHNHMWRSGVLDGEAWGRSRDKENFPGPKGNGHWSQHIYYHALNCGLRIPPTAGSASGVLPNPVGYNRCYVKVDGDFSYDSWWQGLRAGRVFVTNGPLLMVKANGHHPGHVFSAPGDDLEIKIEGNVVSNEPITQVEVVQDGGVVQYLFGDAVNQRKIETTVQFRRSGWFLVRVFTKSESTFRFASTGPFYVELLGQERRIHRHSAEFFMRWAQQRHDDLAAQLSGLKRRDVLADHQQGIKYWREAIKLSYENDE